MAYHVVWVNQSTGHFFTKIGKKNFDCVHDFVHINSFFVFLFY